MKILEDSGKLNTLLTARENESSYPSGLRKLQVRLEEMLNLLLGPHHPSLLSKTPRVTTC